VLLSEGSSARETEITLNRPMDAVIVGIVDVISENGKTVYQK
jgi:ethanolamine utilization protein EutN/carbon dioxide concentrating mechanism protein CcmL